MIERIWHGYTSRENAPKYEALLREEVFAGIAAKQVKGYKGIRLLKRELKTQVEFVTIMTFDNLRAVVEFAGEDYEKAYVPPEAQSLLSSFDPTSAHYEVIESREYP